MKIFFPSCSIELVELAQLYYIGAFRRISIHFSSKDLHFGPSLLIVSGYEELLTVLKTLYTRQDHLHGHISIGIKNVNRAKKYIKEDFRIVKAAGGLVIHKAQWLLIYRRGRWDLPKGKCDPKERLQETACREVAEECNVKVQCIHKIITTYHALPTTTRKKFSLKKTSWYAMALLEGHKIRPQRVEGIEKAELVPEHQARTYLEDSYTSIQEVVKYYTFFSKIKRDAGTLSHNLQHFSDKVTQKKPMNE